MRQAAEPGFDLGVLLVHGIGSQRQGETVADWGDALVQTLAAATPEDVHLTLEEAGLGGDPHVPAHAIVNIRAGDRRERWVLAEAWWADTFLPPTYGELARISLAALPWTIASHFAHRRLRRDEQDKLLTRRDGQKAGDPGEGGLSSSRRGSTLYWVATIGQMLLGLLLAPVLALGLLALVLLGLLPIPQIRSFVMLVQATLSGTVGDSIAFARSPIKAAAIRTRMASSMNWLQDQECTRIAVVAHSQGAAVALDALGGIDVGLGVGNAALPQKDRSRIDLMVTFGAGIKKLALLKRQFAKLQSKHRPSVSPGTPVPPGSPDRKKEFDPVHLTMAAFVVWTFTTVYLVWDLLTCGVSPATRLIQHLVYAGMLFGFAVVSVTLIALMRRLPESWRTGGGNVGHSVRVGVGLVLVMASLGGFLLYARRTGVSPIPSLTFVAALIMTISVAREILFGEFARDLPTWIRRPGHVRRWVDFYASADPVPAGSTPGANASIEIWNENSVVGDHVNYWQNRTGFVLPLLSLLSRRSGSPLWNRLSRRSVVDVERGRFRARWLTAARWLIPASWLLAAMVALITRASLLDAVTGGTAALMHSLGLGRIAGRIPEWVLLVVSSLVLASIAFGVVRFIWRRWTNTERNRILADERDSGMSGWALLFRMAMFFMIGSALFAERALSQTGATADSWQQLTVGYFMMCLGFSVVLTGVIRLIRPLWRPGS